MADKDINSLKKELFNLKIMKKSGQLTETSQFKKVKKQIASLLTKERLNKNALTHFNWKSCKKIWRQNYICFGNKTDYPSCL